MSRLSVLPLDRATITRNDVIMFFVVFVVSVVVVDLLRCFLKSVRSSHIEAVELFLDFSGFLKTQDAADDRRDF